MDHSLYDYVSDGNTLGTVKGDKIYLAFIKDGQNISYEEYLIHSVPVALQIQEEFESWTHMYESYYYGYLYFLGRNDYNDKSALMWGYANYGIFESCLFVPLKAE